MTLTAGVAIRYLRRVVSKDLAGPRPVRHGASGPVSAGFCLRIAFATLKARPER